MVRLLLAKRLGSIALAIFFGTVVVGAHGRECVDLDGGWQFRLGDNADWSAAAMTPADLKDWRPLDLPHDWSIEGERSHDAPGGGAAGFFTAGVGWYRRDFDVPVAWKGKSIQLEFEGIYRRSQVWCNGELLASHDSGYLPLRIDLSKHLRFGRPNTIAVRVDNSDQPNARWYTGSGIYRHVRLFVRSSVHCDPDDFSYATTHADADSAVVAVAATLRNDSQQVADAELRITLTYGDRHVVKSLPSCRIEGGGTALASGQITIERPQLWRPEQPTLYDAAVAVVLAGNVVDEFHERVGFRTVAASAEQGLLLNGKHVDLLGGDLHHDHGPLGAASFDGAERRRVAMLKSAGFNAIRTSHNPPAPAFLAACDELGILVIDEAFDGWEKRKTTFDGGPAFVESAETQVAELIRRDQRHPSVIMWSLGNEVYERGEPRGLEWARQLVRAARTAEIVQPRRPLTVALNGLGPSRPWSDLDPLFAEFDVAGYNYEFGQVDADRKRVPSRIVLGSETYPGEAYRDWRTTRDNPNVLGSFVWSAVDYLGEAGIGRVFAPGEQALPHWEGNHFPWHGGACGDIDLVGERRPHSHIRNIVWDRGEKLDVAVVPPSAASSQLTLWSPPQLAAHWSWRDSTGKPLRVVVTSRHPAVRLTLNGRPIGEQPTGEAHEFRAEFAVPYAPGTLAAIGLDEAGREVERMELVTAESATSIALASESRKMPASRSSLAFINVSTVDDAVRVDPGNAAPVTYSVTGPATIAGIGSGDLSSAESYQANPRRAFQGRAQVILRSTGKPGPIVLRAEAPGLKPAKIEITAQ